jgi:hypothetical protein
MGELWFQPVKTYVEFDFFFGEPWFQLVKIYVEFDFLPGLTLMYACVVEALKRKSLVNTLWRVWSPAQRSLTHI